MSPRKADFDSVDLSDEFVQRDFHRDAEPDFGTLLGAGLKNRLLILHFAVDRLAFTKKVGDRFFTVDIFAVAKRC